MADGISAEELNRARNQQKAELLMSRESPAAVAGWIGRHLLVFGRYIQLAEIIRRIEEVQAADIIRMAEQLCAAPLAFAALGPVKGVPGYDAIAAAVRRR